MQLAGINKQGVIHDQVHSHIKIKFSTSALPYSDARLVQSQMGHKFSDLIKQVAVLGRPLCT